VTPDAHDVSASAVGVHREDLFAPVVENRHDDAATAWRRLADLDLAIASIQPAVQLEFCRDFAGQPIAIRERSHDAS
jgi:hypothetical protein